MPFDASPLSYPRTQAVRQVLAGLSDTRAIADLLFLEAWVLYAPSDLAASLRASQIRRANPVLVSAIQQELAAG